MLSVGRGAKGVRRKCAKRPRSRRMPGARPGADCLSGDPAMPAAKEVATAAEVLRKVQSGYAGRVGPAASREWVICEGMTKGDPGGRAVQLWKWW